MPSLWNEFALGDAILIGVAFAVGRLVELRSIKGQQVASAYTVRYAERLAEQDVRDEIELRARILAERQMRDAGVLPPVLEEIDR